MDSFKFTEFLAGPSFDKYTLACFLIDFLYKTADRVRLCFILDSSSSGNFVIFKCLYLTTILHLYNDISRCTPKKPLN